MCYFLFFVVVIRKEYINKKFDSIFSLTSQIIFRNRTDIIFIIWNVNIIVFFNISLFFSLLFVKSFNIPSWFSPNSSKTNWLGNSIVFNSCFFVIDRTTDFAIDDLAVQQSLTVEDYVSFWCHEVTTFSSLVILFLVLHNSFHLVKLL